MSKNEILYSIVIFSFLGKIIQLYFLPNNYFYDSERVNYMVIAPGNEYSWGGSYEVTADIFRKINLLNFTTIQQWSVSIGIIFSLILILMLENCSITNDREKLFLWCSVGMLNIYVFTIGKDIVQYVIFLFVYIVCNIKCNRWIKVTLVSLIFYYESTFFRSYYLVMAGLFVLVFLILRKLTANKQRIFFAFLTIFVVMFTAVYLMQFINPDDYDELLTIKTYNENKDANTAINNLISGNSFRVFVINYFINLIRLVIPIELLFKGIGYIPFLFFMYLLVMFIKDLLSSYNNFNEDIILYLSVFLSYILVSALFEPDFGSWARHLSASMPLIYLVVFRNSNTSSMSIESESSS